MNPVTLERAKELLNYDPTSGVLTWKKANSNRVKVGAVAGTLDSNGYITIGIDGVHVKGHWLAWLFVYRQAPSADIDHINRIRNDNRISNLRLATRSENNANRPALAKSKSGIKGVSWDKEKRKWAAFIRKDYKTIALGRFNKIEDAAEAYRKKAAELYGDFGRLAA